MRRLPWLAALAVLTPGLAAAAPSQTPEQILAAAPATDWRALDPADTLYMDLPKGRVVILLAPGFAPKTIANIKTLVRSKYFDDSAIVRSQDNYVVQWSQEDKVKKASQAKRKGFAEFERPVSASLVRLPDHDTYAPQTGFDGDFAERWRVRQRELEGPPRSGQRLSSGYQMQNRRAIFRVNLPVFGVGNAPFVAEDFQRIRRLD